MLFVHTFRRKLPAVQKHEHSQAWQIRQKNQLCIKCLSKSHQAVNCDSKNCSICNLPHHSLLHSTAKRFRNNRKQKVRDSEATQNERKSTPILESVPPPPPGSPPPDVPQPILINPLPVSLIYFHVDTDTREVYQSLFPFPTHFGS